MFIMRDYKQELNMNNVPMSPVGGRMVVGVTPSTSLIAFLVQPNSATICSLVKVVKGC